MSVSSVEKCPTSYEEYNFTLPKLYRKTALDELRESDEIRDQALRQMRSWIAKNPTIQRCRTDGPFLLRFLRVRKFNHMAACENLERYLALRQTVASWFQKLDTNEAWVEEMVDDWPILPLGYDDRGRLIILIKMGNFNVERFGNVDQIRLMMMILESYYDEEKMQIAGCVFVFDDTGLTMSHVAQWSLTDIKRFINCVNHTIPLRIKEVHVVNLPRYAVAVGEMCLSFASAKLKERIHCHRSMDSLTKVVAQSLLPKEYDGKVPINELKKQLHERLKLERDRILALDQMAVDQSRFSSLWKDSHAVGDGQDDSFGVVGSFRKLNVD